MTQLYIFPTLLSWVFRVNTICWSLKVFWQISNHRNDLKDPIIGGERRENKNVLQNCNTTNLLAWGAGAGSPLSLSSITLCYVLVAPECQPTWTPHAHKTVAKYSCFSLVTIWSHSSLVLLQLCLLLCQLFLPLCFSLNITSSRKLSLTLPSYWVAPFCSHKHLYISQSLPLL